MKKYPVVKQSWLETERGGGQRPDGCSYHLNVADRDAYVKEYWNRQPDSTPDEYSRPAGEPILVDVDKKLYKKIEKSKNGVRKWHHEGY